MANFYKDPIRNSPYEYPGQHWLLEDGLPTTTIVESRRECSYLTPIPKSKKRRKDKEQADLFEQPKVSIDGAEYDTTSIVNEVRSHVDKWRNLPESQWGVTAPTARLLRHWRTHDFSTIRPFFCQIEAVETAIWLAEVAPRMKSSVTNFQKYLESVNAEANPELFRIALKLATGAGKTMVMSMLIAWQVANAVRSPNSKKYSRAFLIVAPGITIRDRLRVLYPNDTESYYREREILPSDMMGDIDKAKIVITNYHAFRLRENIEVSKGTRRLAEGRTGVPMQTKETEGQMVRRVMGELMGEKVVVLNDEAHHCYRRKIKDAVDSEDDLKGEDKTTAKAENELARMWVSGLEAVKRQMGVLTVYDLSATPFFLRGSGYREGTLFPWVMSDFSLMDAIEAGIVKLPRVPVADILSDSDTMPKLRKLWEEIGTKLPKGKGGKPFDPKKLPPLLQTGLHALYGHYEKTFNIWRSKNVEVPPVFIIVCANVKSSKAIYDFVSGWEWEKTDGFVEFNQGRLPLFTNFNEHGDRIERPRTLLIDSQQLESGDALDPSFRKTYAHEIDRFRREMVARAGSGGAVKTPTDAELLREVMNTVGQKGKLGGDIRCVVSVSMLTEGWDANTITHILGVRAFGTQLLCEQVVGRGLRRLNYTTNDEGKFGVEYSDILGIPFDFTAKSEGGEIIPPPPFTQIQVVKPDRDPLEITFPNVDGYRIDLPKETIKAEFNDDSKLRLSPMEVGPTKTLVHGIVGEGIELTVEVLKGVRKSEIS